MVMANPTYLSRTKQRGLLTVSVLLNTTAPGAARQLHARKSHFPRERLNLVTATDINGDGKLDMLVANEVPPPSRAANTTATGAVTPSFATQGNVCHGKWAILSDCCRPQR